MMPDRRPIQQRLLSWYSHGLGRPKARLEYFVIRLDVGLFVHDPSYDRERWRVGTYQWRDRTWRQQNLVFNLAIGYPF